MNLYSFFFFVLGKLGKGYMVLEYWKMGGLPNNIFKMENIVQKVQQNSKK